jgi:hypothetical protein
VSDEKHNKQNAMAGFGGGKQNNRCLLSLYLEAIAREMPHNRISRNQTCDLSSKSGGRRNVCLEEEVTHVCHRISWLSCRGMYFEEQEDHVWQASLVCGCCSQLSGANDFPPDCLSVPSGRLTSSTDRATDHVFVSSPLEMKSMLILEQGIVWMEVSSQLQTSNCQVLACDQIAVNKQDMDGRDGRIDSSHIRESGHAGREDEEGCK